MASGSVGLNDAIELRLGSQQSVAIRANLFLLDMEQGMLPQRGLNGLGESESGGRTLRRG